jgi:synaptobrevin family protein YKT6
MTFFSKTLVEKTKGGERQCVEEKDYRCYVHVRHDGMAGVVIADQDYPQRVAFSLITKAQEEFSKRYPPETWGAECPFPMLNDMLSKYQDPKEADSMIKVQAELDETKVILHKTIENVLERGEKLDDLVGKSDELSAQSKMFYKQARKANSCCTLL